ncbi:MAG: CoA transferase [Burkholderiales bacterium]|nr:MAG: CoA transferase [Burkholderiales bacterium]
MNELPLNGVLVVTLEQAVAAPYCTSRLADMGARVIKVERPEGDFARNYDEAVFGEASYFVWINRGKESVALDLKSPDDRALIERMLAVADVFVQNLAPGAAARLGLGADALRERHPRLITCDISGYGEAGPGSRLKAYDLLVQAESGLVAVNGAPGDWGRIGVSLCDIGAGMNAVIGILQALMQREHTGEGAAIKVSLFGTAAELMAVPYLQARYGGQSPQRVGLKHPSVAPYGAFRCADGRDIVISIQNEREWRQFCEVFMGDVSIATEPRFAGNPQRCRNREALDALIQSRFGALQHAEATELLTRANSAYASINSVEELIRHPQLRTTPMPVGDAQALLPEVPYQTPWSPRAFKPAPGLDADGARLRAEFAATGSSAAAAVGAGR